MLLMPPFNRQSLLEASKPSFVVFKEIIQAKVEVKLMCYNSKEYGSVSRRII